MSSSLHPVEGEFATLHRRRFLLCASLACAVNSLPAWARRGERLSHNPFTLGVASGDPEPDNVLIWTRLTPPQHTLGEASATELPPSKVRWELASDIAFRHIVSHGEAMALSQLGHSVHVQVNGLAPDHWYYYRFMLGDAISAVGRCRTAPAWGSAPQRLRLAFASCQRWEHGYYAAWRQVTEDAPDLVLFLGDYIYEYAAPAMTLGMARPQPLRVAQNLQDYRDRYALHKSDPQLQAAHAACNWSVIWDDHEVENDYTHEEGRGETARFLNKRAAAWQAFYENMPLRTTALARNFNGLQLYRSLHWGNLAHIHMLDGRQFRDVQACRTAGQANNGSVLPSQCQSLQDPARSFLGQQQEQWIYNQLRNDSASQPHSPRWSLLAQTTLFSERRMPSGAQATDSWDGYPAARQRLAQQIARSAPRNTVLLGGDLHQNYVCAVPQDASRAPDKNNPVIASEFCGTSISSRSGTYQAKLDAIMSTNPQVLYARCEERGYGLVDITPASMTTELRAVVNPMRADSAVYTLAKFAVQDKQPGPRKI